MAEVTSDMVPIFAPVLAACVGFLGSLPEAKHIRASTVLIHQNERVKKVRLLQSGLVKIINLNAEGHETLIGLRSDGWYAGSASLMLNMPSLYSVCACTDCTVIEIAAGEFFECLRRNQEMMNHFIIGLCREVVSYSALRVELSSSKAEDRLNLFLRERAAALRTGKTMDPLPLLKQVELAQLISVTPEHLSRLRKRRRLRGSTPEPNVTPALDRLQEVRPLLTCERYQHRRGSAPPTAVAS